MKKGIDIMDVLNAMSFYIGVQNLEENLSQKDADNLIRSAVNDIHTHLQQQDSKIDMILEAIKK